MSMNNYPGKYHGADNVYFKNGSPALMSDGRFITYHNSSNELTEKMRRMNGITNPHEWRAFMQNNGDLFMNTEREFQIKNNVCNTNTACSQGYYDLWNKNGGDWRNINR